MRKAFGKNLILVFLCASMPAILIGGVVFPLALRSSAEAWLDAHRRLVRERAERLDAQYASIELGMAHWAFGPRFNDKLGSTEWAYAFEEARDITRTLIVMQGSHAWLSGVELVLLSPRPVRFSPEYESLEDANLVPYERLLGQSVHMFWADATTLVHRIPGGARDPFGLLIVRLDRQRVTEALRDLTSFGGGAWLLDENRNVVLETGGSADVFGALVTAVRTHAEFGEGDRPVSIRLGGATYAVSGGVMDRLGRSWSYVSAVPTAEILAPTTAASRIVFGGGLVGLFVAALLSWLTSSRVTSPVARLVRLLSGHAENTVPLRNEEWRTLETEWRNQQLPMLKEGFLLQWLNDRLTFYGERELRRRIERLGWRTEGCRFVPAIVRLSGLSAAGAKFSPDDRELVTFAAVNIASELAGQSFEQAAFVRFHDLSFGIVVFDRDASTVRDRFRHYAQTLVDALEKMLAVRAAIAIGESAESATDVARSFERAAEASRWQSLAGEHRIADLESEAISKPGGELVYPFELEERLLRALRDADREEAERLTGAFIDELVRLGNRGEALRHAAMLLAGAVQRLMLSSGTWPSSSYSASEGADAYRRLAELSEPDDFRDWMLNRFIRPHLRAITDRTAFQMRRTVERALEEIERRCLSMDFSLESCADAIGIHPCALSKAFKQIMGINFIDYVTSVRIERAKRLLRESDMKIADIAEAVGYRHDYFNRVFKRREGVTPGQYRDNSTGFCMRKSEFRMGSNGADGV